MLDSFGFFMKFLGCVLVEDCVAAILGFLIGEIKCEFSGFWFGERENGRMMELFEVNKRKWNKKHSIQ